MKKIEEEIYICNHCKNDVKIGDEYCTHCGSILVENVQCKQHLKVEAEGICIICGLSCCKKCGAFINNLFLCNTHSEYEIYEGMARIYGSLNDTPAQHANTCLEQAGFHPFVFCRVQPQGGPQFVYTLFRSAGDSGGHIINEIKVMVPCEEVINAEKFLRKIKILESNQSTA